MSLPNKPKKPTNRPGLSQIAYRIGDYNSFRERLLSYLAYYLPELKTRDPQDPAIAIVDAWAVVADVLSFYQERIANEGYLLTAIERRSVLELARAIGYELKPGVAASTYLAFIVEDTPDGPREVTLPKEAQVMSVPNEGESPQTFETSEEILARVAWNQLTPRQDRPHQITNNTQQLYLEGIATQLQPGDSILLLDREELEVARYLLTLTDVVAVPEAGHTLVSWKQPLKLDAPLRQPQVFAFRQQAALFGNLAPDWLQDVPDEIKRTADATLKGGVFKTKDQGDRWFPLNTGLPNADILCLVVNQSNDFFLGTPGLGIFRSTDRGATWKQIIAGLTNLTVQTLYVDWERDYILAGTPGGGVFRSTDNGENWSSIGDGTIRVESSTQAGDNSVETVNTGLPDTVVRSLVTCSKPIEQNIGTLSPILNQSDTKLKVDNDTVVTEKLRVGDILTTADGQVRTVTNIDTKNSDTFLIVDSAFRPSLPTSGIDFSIGGTYIFAGTEEGVYRTQDQGKNWYLKGLSNRVIRALLVIYRATNEGTGTIGGTAVTGIGTTFTTKLNPDDIIIAAEQIRTIRGVASNTSLVIEQAFEPDLAVGTAFFTPERGTGTITSNGTTVTGTSTVFESDLQLGDVIIAAEQIRTIEEINPDDTLNLNQAFEPNLEDPTPFFIPERGTGTITSNGTTVTGTSTTFDSELHSGDVIIAAEQIKTIEEINSNNTLNLNQAFESNLEDPTPFFILQRGTGTIGGTAITGISTSFTTELNPDGIIIAAEQIRTVSGVASNTSLVIEQAFEPDLASDTAFFIPQRGTGTITSNGTTVTGTSTVFDSELQSGDVIIAAEKIKTIEEINPDNTLNLNQAFEPNLEDPTPFFIPQRGTGTITSNGTTVTGAGTDFDSELQSGDMIIAAEQIKTIEEINSDNTLNLNQAFESNLEDPTPFFILQRGTGTIGGTAITGISTSFTTELNPDGIIIAAEQIRTVKGIASDTTLVIEQTFEPDLASDTAFFIPISHQGIGTISSEDTTVRGVGTNFTKELAPGDLLIVDEQIRTVRGLASETTLVIDRAFEPALEAVTSFFYASPGIGTITSDDRTVTFSTPQQLAVGDIIIAEEQIKTITAIASDTEMTIDTAFNSALNAASYWILPVGRTHVFAGTDDGSFRSSDYGETWIPVNNGLSNKNVTSLATDFRVGTGTISSNSTNTTVTGNGTNFINELKPGDTIVAAGQTRVITSINAETKLTVDIAFAPDLPVGTSFAIANRTDLFAGTADAGIFRSRNNGRIWEQVALKSGTGTITSEGNKVIGDNGTTFTTEIEEGYTIITGRQIRVVIEIVSDNELILDQPFDPNLVTATFTINAGLTNLKITSLVVDASLGTGTIASNNDNNKRVDGNGTLFAQELRVGDSITALGQTRIVTGIDAEHPNTVLFINEAFDSNPLPAGTNFTINNLFAGTVDGGVFRSVDHGDTWSEINGDVAAISPTQGLATKEITSLAIAKKGTLLAGTRFSGFVEQEWPGFQLLSQKIDLDTLYTGILEDSWLVLVNGDQFEALQVENVSDGSRRDFLLDTTITSIIPTAPVTTPSNFSLRNTTVLLQSEQLAMAQESLDVTSQQTKIFLDPISDNSIYLSEFVQGLENGQSLIIAGKHPRAKVKLGGMARSQNWNETNAELEERTIQALSILPEGYLLVGTDKGVDIFSSLDQGMTWKSLSKGLSNQNVTSFVTSREEGIGTIVGNGTEIIGQKNTEFFNQLQAGDLITVGGQTRAVINIENDTKLSIDNAFSVSINGTLPFAIDKLFAGTDQGIFRFCADTLKWEQVNQQELQNIQTLAIKQADNGDNPVQLFAGTKENGVLRSDDYGRNWTEINHGLTEQNIRSLLVNPDNGQIFAGTASNGIFRLSDTGDNWQQIAYTKPGTGTIASNGTIVSGSRTAFGRELKPGDLIIAAGQTRVVTELDSITPDIKLTINTAFIPDLPSRTTFNISTGLTDMSISELGIYRQPDTVTISSNGITVTGKETSFVETLSSGDILLANNEIPIVNQIISDTQLTLDCPFNINLPPETAFLTPPRSKGTISSARTTIRGKNTVFTTELRVGDKIIVAAQKRTVTSISSDVICTIDSAFDPNITSFEPNIESFNIEREGTTKQGSGTIFDGVVIGKGTNFNSELRAGDAIIAAGQIKIVEAVFSATEIAVNAFFETDLPEGTPYFVPCRGQGTISSTGTTITGDENTVFTTELQKNDVILAVGEIRTVNAFNLTIDAEFEPNLTTETAFFIPRKGRGTIQSEGTTVTGNEATAFITDLEVGDIIIAANQIKTVEAVNSQARSLTIDAEFEPNLTTETAFFIPRKGRGTIQSEGTTVTGDEATAFTTDLEVGDIIIAANQIRTVNAFNLVIDTAFNEGNLSNTPFSFFSRTVLLASTTNGGIFRSSNSGGHWEAINTGLTDLEISSLAVHSHNGYLFAGTANGRLFRSTNLGNIWNSLDAGLSSQSVEVIMIANDDKQLPEEKLPIDILFAGAGNKVFRSSDYGRNWQDIHWQRINQGLTSLTVQAIAIHREPEKLYLFVGTREGAFSSTDGGEHWQPINDGLTSPDVRTLLACSSSLQLYAGTKEGLFRSTDYGEHWTAVDIGIAQAEIRALASNPITKMLFAATFTDGVIRYSPDSDRWIALGLTDAFLQAMTINPANGDIYIGTTSHGIFHSSNQGNSWQQLTKTRSGTGRITSDGINVTGEDTQFNRELRLGAQITVVGQKRTVVTISPENPNTSITIDQPFRPDLRSSTSFTIHTGLNNLNVTALAVHPLPGTGAITIEGIKVTGIGTDFNCELTVGDTITVVDQTRVDQTRTVIEIDPDKEELILDREFTTDIIEGTPFSRDIIFAGTAGSGIFRSTNQGKGWEEVNTGLNNLEIRCLTVDKYSNRILAGTALGGVFCSTDLGDHWQPLDRGLTNTDIRAIAIDSTNIFVGGIGILLSQDGFAAVEVQPDDWLYVMRPPQTTSTSVGQNWQVRNLDNFIGTLTTLKDDDLTLYPGTDEDETISELGIINIPPNNQQLPRLTLEKHLTNSYDPATVTIYGNIVEATHGETVSEEILGSGDGTISNQRFQLQKPPLTYVSTPTASGAESTLKVYVNDVEWQQDDSLYLLNKTAQSYIIRLEDDGTTQVIFGDGERGARLPSGQENIVAKYRSGIGLEGNIGAESLTILKTRPLGLEEVTNPLPATGGAEREDPAEARTNAPLTIRTLDRIVSLQDFEDFACTFAGISKAQTVPLWTGDTQLVHITIAAADGESVSTDSILYNNLVNAIDAARDPVQQVQVDSYEAILFNLEAKVVINPRYQTDKVKSTIRSALLQTFSFERREFGQAVTASEIIATIQNIEGVVAVDLDSLYSRGSSKILNQSLIAQKARWDVQTNQVSPAQLLFLDADSITLSTSSTL